MKFGIDVTKITRQNTFTSHHADNRNGENMSSNAASEIVNFIAFMDKNNCAPGSSSEIVPTEKWKDYQLAGDKNGKKKGYYILKIDGAYISGACGDRRTGETFQYHNRPTKQLTDEERRAYAKRRDADRRERERQEAQRQSAAAVKSKARWDAAKPAEQHPYLERKGISGEGARVDDKGMLLIPLYSDNKLWSIQTIDKDGVKMFPAGGRKKGCFCPIAAAGDTKDTLYICEGFATGATLRAATGGAVVVAFDAGNLKPVAEAMRKKYPDAVIVICADNDHGKQRNAGIEGAKAAVAVCGGLVVAPNGIEGTDWNDAQAERGIDFVRDSVAAMVADRGGGQFPAVVAEDTAAPPSMDWMNDAPPYDVCPEDARMVMDLYVGDHDAEPENDDWKARLVCKKDGTLEPKRMVNVQLLLEHAPKFRDMFCYDEFAHEKILVQCPDWETPSEFKPRPITDEDSTWLAMALEQKGLTLDPARIRKIHDAVIMKRRRNPAKEYFSGLKWDGKERLKSWLTYYAGCEEDDAKYLEAVGMKWMVAAVARVFNPGEKFDHILIFEGQQGARKSTMLRELATIRGRSYFDDTIKVSDLGDDKTIPKLQGVLIIELAEMAGMRKAEIEKLKQQVTIQEDRIVRKYANEATRYPRQFVFAGTINPLDGYLDDPTGNRRFLPVQVGRRIDIEAIKQDKEQLWAEAVALYKRGFSLWIDDDLMELVKNAQSSREIISPWLPEIEALCRGKNFVSNADVWLAVGIEKGRRSARDQLDIAKVMLSLGFKRTRRRVGGDREYGWERQGAEEEISW